MFYLGIFLLFIGFVVSLVGAIMMAVAAFRVSALWGVVVLFVPFGALVFIIKYWPEAKKSFFVNLAGAGAAALGWLAFAAGIASMAGAQFEAAARAAADDMKVEVETRQPVHKTVRSADSRSSRAASAPVAVAQDAAGVSSPAGESSPSGSLADMPLPTPGADVPPPIAAISPNEIARHIGEVLVLTDHDGRRIRGTLLSVDRDALRIERDMSGGSVSYAIARKDVREIVPAY